MSRVQFLAEAMVRFILFAIASRLAMEPSQPLDQLVPGALSYGVKWTWHKADHLPPPSVEVKNMWSYTSTPEYVFMVW
jgi:hypothetical protein